MTQTVPAFSKPKQPLALLKEYCDKRKLTYKVKNVSSDSEVRQQKYRFKVTIIDEMSNEEVIQTTSDLKVSKREASHDAAAKAIEKLGIYFIDGHYVHACV